MPTFTDIVPCTRNHPEYGDEQVAEGVNCPTCRWENDRAAAALAHPDRYYFTSAETHDEGLAGGRAIYNGCTTVWLREKYGPTVAHHAGLGWYMDAAARR